ncbi:hypothetical protein PBCVFr5L_872L [Paramecium bursaria Chlorella virus Fr5L]|nr:hypothetical protein PBCVFr5L_872L [Paramecium bursaria Chlorella virus Fr5L]
METTTIPVDNVYVTIWSKETLLERSRNLHNSEDVDIMSWVSDDRHFPIFGKKINTPIQDNGVVLFYISEKNNNRVVGAGRVKMHYSNARSMKVYEKPEHNEYCVVLEQVMFFRKEYTSNDSIMKSGTQYFTTGISKGSRVVQRLCTQDPGTEFYALCQRVLNDMATDVDFASLFRNREEVHREKEALKVYFKKMTSEFKMLYHEVPRVSRSSVHDITTTVDGKVFSEWRYLQNFCLGIDDTTQFFVPGVYEIGYIGRDDAEVIENSDVHVVYVGESGNIFARITQHSRLNAVRFNDIVRNGNALVWRYVHLENKYEAQFVESQFLAMYNYHLNIASNQ